MHPTLVSCRKRTDKEEIKRLRNALRSDVWDYTNVGTTYMLSVVRWIMGDVSAIVFYSVGPTNCFAISF